MIKKMSYDHEEFEVFEATRLLSLIFVQETGHLS